MSPSDDDIHKIPTEPSKRLRKIIESGGDTPPITGPDALPVPPAETTPPEYDDLATAELPA